MTVFLFFVYCALKQSLLDVKNAFDSSLLFNVFVIYDVRLLYHTFDLQ